MATVTRRAALVALGCVAAVALGVTLLALTPGATDLPPGGRAVPVLAVVVGWGFAGLGAYAAWQRPENATGWLMIAFGLAVLLSGLSIADRPWLDVVSGLADSLALAIFVHLLLAFPSGRLDGRASRLVVAASYITALAPDGVVKSAVGLALALAAVVLLLRRARAASPLQRSAFAPLAVAAAVLLGLAAVSISAQALDLSDGVQKAAQLVFIAGFAALPVAFLAGLVRSRFFRTATVGRVIERLTHGPGGGAIEDALATALGDPALAVAFWLPEENGYADREGRAIALPAGRDGTVATEITHQGRRVGALIHDAALAGDPELMRAAAGAAGLALENDRLAVELRARLQALRASRTRIVETGDAERRRLSRDLHDGAQQRLVALLLDLQLARDRWDNQPESSRALVDDALEHARAAVEELRDLASGIHPAVLSQRGLDAALESLANRSSVPVELHVALDERLPSSAETAAYFVVAEALTNVAKYAEATHARVTVRREDGDAVVEIRDDGVGGADAAGGSGLRGLDDRVGALDGTIELESPPGRGTLLRARIPLRHARKNASTASTRR
jgi:signal transduction histidine kinase